MQRACYIGLDYGRRKLGVAVGDSISVQARPLQTINIQYPNWQIKLDECVQTWQPQAFILGKPIPPEEEQNQENSIVKEVEAFAVSLEDRYKRPVYLQDESYSSWEARQLMVKLGVKGKGLHADDAMAAKVILEQWLEDEYI